MLHTEQCQLRKKLDRQSKTLALVHTRECSNVHIVYCVKNSSVVTKN